MRPFHIEALTFRLKENSILQKVLLTSLSLSGIQTNKRCYIEVAEAINFVAGLAKERSKEDQEKEEEFMIRLLAEHRDTSLLTVRPLRI